MPAGVARGEIRVLVAEGAKPFREVLCSVLDHDGRFRVVGTADSGNEAISFDGQFDLALVDLGIRGLGSLATVAGLRARTPPPAVVILSPTGAVYLRHAAAAEGAAGFVVIPDDLDHVSDRLASLVEASLPASRLDHQER